MATSKDIERPDDCVITILNRFFVCVCVIFLAAICGTRCELAQDSTCWRSPSKWRCMLAAYFELLSPIEFLLRFCVFCLRAGKMCGIVCFSSPGAKANEWQGSDSKQKAKRVIEVTGELLCIQCSITYYIYPLRVACSR